MSLTRLLLPELTIPIKKIPSYRHNHLLVRLLWRQMPAPRMMQKMIRMIRLGYIVGSGISSTRARP